MKIKQSKLSILPHRAYSTFPDQVTAAEIASAHTTELEQLGSTICAFGVEQQVGICLLHSHFPLWEGEFLLTEELPDGLLTRVTEVIPSSAAPSAWRGCSGTAEPIEFGTVAEVCAVIPKTFLSEFFRQANNLGVDSIFGLTTLRAHSKTRRNALDLEITDEDRRMMITLPVPEDELKTDKTIVTTQWRFGQTEGIATSIPVQACWYGSSRCCCGSDSEGRRILARHHPDQLRILGFN